MPRGGRATEEGDRSECLQTSVGKVGASDRHAQAVECFRARASLVLPEDLDYAAVGGLTNEVRAKLETIRPATLGQAGRIEGMTPGALTALLAFVRRRPDRKRSVNG